MDVEFERHEGVLLKVMMSPGAARRARYSCQAGALMKEELMLMPAQRIAALVRQPARRSVWRRPADTHAHLALGVRTRNGH
ncbi:hypothetical protein [Roseateles toxinivorans]|uniref:hypothetical protein n=1 Tax=Roseateles toxinivorans TaxID=270368 RepID=UPI00105EA9D1|nr:hypothetical protein [Roseateles toxinivorans]